MRKLIVLLSVFVLFLTGPMTAFATSNNSVSDSRVKVEGTDEEATFEVEGVTYTLKLETDGHFQKAIIDDGQTVETVSYDSQKDELRFNGEKVSEEELENMKSIISETNEGDLKVDLTEIDDSFQTFSSHNYKRVGSTVGSVNITIATVVFVTSLIMMIPTSAGAVAVIFGVKVIAAMVSAVIASTNSTGHKKLYYKTSTYFKNLGGYWWNKHVIWFYSDSNYKKLINSYTHETKYGKKY